MSKDTTFLDFIREHVRSVWALEQLLLLRRTAPQSLSPDEMVKELRASTRLVAANLEAFERAGLALGDDDGRYRFAPATPVLQRLCDELAQAYAERPVSLINAITAPPDRLQDLADAFKIRKDPK